MIRISFCTYLIGKDWNLEKLAKVAKEAGYDGVEPRTDMGMKHRLSVGFRDEPRTSAENIQKARKLFEDAGVSFASIATGVQFSSQNPQVRKRNIEEAKEYIELADKLGAKVVRLFGGRVPPGVRRADAVDYIAECLNEVGRFAREYDVSPLIEQHDDWDHTVDIVDAMEKVTEENVGVLWNQTTIDNQSFELLKNRLKHFHIHDSTPAILESMRLLESVDFDGYLSLEVGPQPNPEQFLKDHATKMKNYLKQL